MMKSTSYKNPCNLPLTDIQTKYQIINGYGNDIPPGWNLIVDEALEKIFSLTCWKKTFNKVWQVKEKFGTLRIYVDDTASMSPEVLAIITKAEEDAMITCQTCGLEVHKRKCLKL